MAREQWLACDHCGRRVEMTGNGDADDWQFVRIAVDREEAFGDASGSTRLIEATADLCPECVKKILGLVNPASWMPYTGGVTGATVTATLVGGVPTCNLPILEGRKHRGGMNESPAAMFRERPAPPSPLPRTSTHREHG